MKIQVAEITPYGVPILVALVASEYTTEVLGRKLIERLEPCFPTHPIMLISVERNGFRAYAPFQTHVLLALIQLEYLDLVELDVPLAFRPQWPRPTPYQFVTMPLSEDCNKFSYRDANRVRLALQAEAELPF